MDSPQPVMNLFFRGSWFAIPFSIIFLFDLFIMAHLTIFLGFLFEILFVLAKYALAFIC